MLSLRIDWDNNIEEVASLNNEYILEYDWVIMKDDVGSLSKVEILDEIVDIDKDWDRTL